MPEAGIGSTGVPEHGPGMVDVWALAAADLVQQHAEAARRLAGQRSGAHVPSWVLWSAVARGQALNSCTSPEAPVQPLLQHLRGHRQH
jgi:hypothetical protein